jgi:hypothetical protein
MSAWLNLFIVVGQVRWMTLAAGILAITLASINIKDFFWDKRGVSLSISDGTRPKLFARMRGFLSADNITTMMLGLGFLLVLVPEALNNVLVALGLLAVALLVTFILAKVFRDRRVVLHEP